MNVPLRTFKETETKLHEALYKNIKLLTLIYPPTDELESVLKKDMFVKSNKSAFQHVVYYLFKTLDPKAAEEKITSWPLYDVKLETKFRTEVVNFVNWIKMEFEEANLVSIMPSQLLTPGGYRFTKFVLSLSNFVIYKHLKENHKHGNAVAPISPHPNQKVTSIILKSLLLSNKATEGRNNKMLQHFQDEFDEALKQSAEVVDERYKVDNDLCSNKQKLEKKKKSVGMSDNLEALKCRLAPLEAQVSHLEKIKIFCEKSRELLECLLSEGNVLEFNKDEFKMPDSVKHLFRDESNLDLVHLFESLSLFLENEYVEIPSFTNEQVTEWIKFVTELNEKCANLEQKFTKNQKELAEMMENFHLDAGK